MTDVRSTIVEWANWFAHNKTTHPFVYSEGSDRMSAIGQWPLKYPVHCDCSAFVTLCYWLAGAADPNGQGYDHEGYTGTLLSHGKGVTVVEATVGDVIVYGPGDGWHTAVIVEAGPDPLTVSMGQNGDPSFVRVSQDGRQPQRYLRFSTEQVHPSHTPDVVAKPAPKVATPVEHVVKAVAHVVEHAPLVSSPDHVGQPQVETSVVETPAEMAHGWPIIRGIEEIVEGLVKGPHES